MNFGIHNMLAYVGVAPAKLRLPTIDAALRWVAREKFYFDSFTTHVVNPVNLAVNLTTLFVVIISYCNVKLSLWWLPAVFGLLLIGALRISRWLARRGFYKMYQAQSNAHNELLQSLKGKAE